MLSHARGEILQHIIYRNPQPADARLAATLVGVDGDEVLVIHELTLPEGSPLRNVAGNPQEVWFNAQYEKYRAALRDTKK